MPFGKTDTIKTRRKRRIFAFYSPSQPPAMLKLLFTFVIAVMMLSHLSNASTVELSIQSPVETIPVAWITIAVASFCLMTAALAVTVVISSSSKSIPETELRLPVALVLWVVYVFTRPNCLYILCIFLYWINCIFTSSVIHQAKTQFQQVFHARWNLWSMFNSW